MKSGSFENVVPPVRVYAGAGEPYKTSLSNIQSNISQQSKLNKTHGGSKYKKRRGGAPASRPTQQVIPQAPSVGGDSPSPDDANSISASAAQTLMNHYVRSEYDSDVVVPPVPQTGGSLLQKLEKLTRKHVKGGRKKINKKNKTRRNRKKQRGKKK